MGFQLFIDDLIRITEKKENELLSLSGLDVHESGHKMIVRGDAFFLINVFLRTNHISGFDTFYFPNTLSEFNFIIHGSDDDTVVPYEYLPLIDQAYTEAKPILQSYMDDYVSGHVKRCSYMGKKRQCNIKTVFDSGLCSLHNGEDIKQTHTLDLPQVIV